MTKLTRSDFDRAVARCKMEILADIASGEVSADVQTFSDLHDFVDANYYGGAIETFDGTEKQVAFWNAVQGAIDQWLRNGRK